MPVRCKLFEEHQHLRQREEGSLVGLARRKLLESPVSFEMDGVFRLGQVGEFDVSV